MDSSFDNRTRASLLARLRTSTVDQAAWNIFVQRYGRQIYRWCRRCQLQETDAQDVTQIVLAKLVEKLRTFTYDPAQRFRAYLRTVTRYACCDFLENQQRAGAGSGDSQVWAALQTVAARTDLQQHLDKEFDRELLDEAMLRVQQRVASHTWEAFQLTAVDGLSGAEAAERLGMKVATVFKAKSKVQKMLHDEMIIGNRGRS